MRFAIIVSLICLFACSEEVSKSEYKQTAALYYANIKECEIAALKSHDQAFKAGDQKEVAQYGYLLAIIYSRNEKYAKAVEFLNNSIEYYSTVNNELKTSQCLDVLAHIYNETGNYDFAYSNVKKALSLNTKDPATFYDLNFRLADICFSLGKNDTANKIINTFLISSLKYSDIGYLFIKGKNYNQAIIYLNKSLSIDQSSANFGNVYTNLAYCYLKKGEISKALYFSNKAMGYENKTAGENLRNRAMIYIKMKEYKLASMDLENSLKYKPNLGEISEEYRLISEGYKKSGNTIEALLYANKSMDLSEKKIELMYEKSKEAEAVRDAAFKYEQQRQIAAERRARIYEIVIFLLTLSVVFYFVCHKINKARSMKSLFETIEKTGAQTI